MAVILEGLECAIGECAAALISVRPIHLFYLTALGCLAFFIVWGMGDLPAYHVAQVAGPAGEHLLAEGLNPAIHRFYVLADTWSFHLPSVAAVLAVVIFALLRWGLYLTLLAFFLCCGLVVGLAALVIYLVIRRLGLDAEWPFEGLGGHVSSRLGLDDPGPGGFVLPSGGAGGPVGGPPAASRQRVP